MSGDFKPAGSLYSEERRIRPQRPEPPAESQDHESTNRVNTKRGNMICGYLEGTLCGPSVEAETLGLRAGPHTCAGSMLASCGIRVKLDAKLTVVQIFEAHRQ